MGELLILLAVVWWLLSKTPVARMGWRERLSWIATFTLVAGVGALCTRAFTSIPLLYIVLAPIVVPTIAATFVAVRRAYLANRETLPRLAPRDLMAKAAIGSLGIALILSTWNGIRIGSSMTASDPFLALAGVFAVLAPHPRRRIAPLWLILPATTILLVVLIDAIAMNGSSSAITPGLRLVAAVALTPLIIGLVAGSYGSMWLLLDCWIFSVAVNCAVGTADYLLHTHIGPSLTGASALGRSSGLTTQVNHLGFVATFALPVIIARLLTERSRFTQGYYSIVGVLAVLALLSSGSRGGLIGGIFAVIATPFFQRSVRERAVVALAVLALILVVAGTFFVNTSTFITLQRAAGQIPASTGVLESDALRSVAYHTAFQQFNSHPLTGVGFATPRAAQSLYLELLAAGGAITLVAFIVFLVGSILSGIGLSRMRDADPKLAALAGATATSMAAWAIMGVAENQVYDRYLLVPCGFLVALRLVIGDINPAAPDVTLGDTKTVDDNRSRIGFDRAGEALGTPDPDVPASHLVGR